MKKILLTLLYTLSLHSQILDVEENWKLFGATKNINTQELENTCIDYIWSYEENQWYLFSNQTVTIDHNPLFEIVQGKGFWVKGSRSCKLEVNPEPIEIVIDNTPINYTTFNDEYYGSNILEQINAKYAYEQNLSGRGTITAVIDSGIEITHEDLDDNLKYYTSLRDDLLQGEDDAGHGTHVAGIIGAERNDIGMHGVAYNTNLISIKVTDKYGQFGHDNLSNACELAQLKGAKVANISLTSTWFDAYNTWVDKYEEVLDKDFTMIMASGNNSEDNPRYPANIPSLSQYSDFTNKLGGFIAVGAVDENNEIASFSNKAGSAKDWYIVAPGYVNSTYNNNSYFVMGGTSMASPIVTGAFALLSELRPDLKGSQIAQILFDSATDLGEVGVDDIYGHGLLNLEKAIKLAKNY